MSHTWIWPLFVTASTIPITQILPGFCVGPSMPSVHGHQCLLYAAASWSFLKQSQIRILYLAQSMSYSGLCAPLDWPLPKSSSDLLSCCPSIPRASPCPTAPGCSLLKACPSLFVSSRNVNTSWWLCLLPHLHALTLNRSSYSSCPYLTYTIFHFYTVLYNGIHLPLPLLHFSPHPQAHKLLGDRDLCSRPITMPRLASVSEQPVASWKTVRCPFLLSLCAKAQSSDGLNVAEGCFCMCM